jgi:hypothetical protein
MKTLLTGLLLITSACGTHDAREELVVHAELTAIIFSSGAEPDTYTYRVFLTDSERDWFKYREAVAKNAFYALAPATIQQNYPPQEFKVTLPAGVKHDAQQVILITFNAI